MFTSIYGIYFILSLAAVYVVMSPYLKNNPGNLRFSEQILSEDKISLYAEELEDLKASFDMKLISEEEYNMQKKLLLQDANKVA